MAHFETATLAALTVARGSLPEVTIIRNILIFVLVVPLCGQIPPVPVFRI